MSISMTRMYHAIESGKLLFPVQLLLILAVTAAVLISGLSWDDNPEVITADAPKAIRYEVIRVSEIPKALMEQEAEKVAIDKDSDTLSVEDIRNRYFRYIVTKIEQAKIYPLSEQKKGHEGRILMKLYIVKSGSVRKVSILRQSRYSGLTRASIDSIKRAMPFRPFPKGIPDDELIVRLKMDFFLE
ncbi:MAG TPA: TonB family protein [Spirochaetota bacterium]|nr:TonB family protein [Spirochaetota bacterium]